MATKIIEGKFMPQYKTAAQWSIANPVLLRGETGVESDTRKFKFGDGVNHWNDLEYANKAYPADIKMTDWAKMLESAYSPITNTDTLLAALQKLQVLVDNGDAYLFRCYGTNSTMSGVAFGSPDGLRGLRAICYNSWVNKILVCAGEITLPAFIRMSETEQAAWLGEHTEHSMSVADLQVTAPVTISDFKNLPSVVTSAADGVIIPIIAPVSASNGPAGLSSAGPAYGHVQVAKTGSTKAYNFLVQMDGSGATKVYSGFLHSTAQTVSWTELGGNSGGRLRDVKYLGKSFWTLISSNDTDIQAFVVDENSPEVPAEYKGEGFGFARHYRDDVGMATVTIKLNSGRVKTFNVTFYGDGSDAYWEETGGSSGSSSGMEKISNWTDLRYAMVNSDEGQGQMVTLPLTRALKSTDIVLVTWRKENASNVDADIAGHAIFHPGAYSYDVGLEVVEDFQDSNNNYGLYLDQNTSEIGSTSLSAYAMSLGGNSYGPHYLITGIYNISGK